MRDGLAGECLAEVIANTVSQEEAALRTVEFDARIARETKQAEEGATVG